VIKVDSEYNRVSLAEYRDPDEKQVRDEARLRLLDSLCVGQVLDGTIDNIVDYGLFVDLGGIAGLVHRSCLLNPTSGDLCQRFQAGQRIQVEVRDIDRERQRIVLAEQSFSGATPPGDQSELDPFGA
jgi:small subunit ribosomal protein S1